MGRKDCSGLLLHLLLYARITLTLYCGQNEGDRNMKMDEDDERREQRAIDHHTIEHRTIIYYYHTLSLSQKQLKQDAAIEGKKD